MQNLSNRPIHLSPHSTQFGISRVACITLGLFTVMAACITAAHAAPFAYAVNQSPRTVSAFTVNTATGALTAVTGVGGVAAAGTDPVGASVDPTGRFVYVPNFSSSDLSAYTINANSGALTAIDANTALAGVQNFATGTNPTSVGIDPAGKFVYVTNYSSHTVSAYTINQTTGALTAVGAAVAAGTNPNHVSIDPTGKFVMSPITAPAVSRLTPSTKPLAH